MAKSYKEVMKALEDSAKNSRRYSSGDHTELVQAIANTPDYQATYYTNPSGDTPVGVTREPVKEYRDALKDMVVKEFGVDKNEAKKMDTVEFSKKHAAAMNDVVKAADHDYMSTGKKLKLPQFGENETAVTLGYEKLPEKVEATNKIVDGKSVPTGKTIKTKERTVTKAGNKVPAWLKSEV